MLFVRQFYVGCAIEEQVNACMSRLSHHILMAHEAACGLHGMQLMAGTAPPSMQEAGLATWNATNSANDMCASEHGPR